MATHSANPGPQKINQASDLQKQFLYIVTGLTLLAMLISPIVFLAVFILSKNLWLSIPSALFPAAIGVALAFSIRHMAARIFPKSHEEIEVDKIKARNKATKQVTRRQKKIP